VHDFESRMIREQPSASSGQGEPAAVGIKGPVLVFSSSHFITIDCLSILRCVVIDCFLILFATIGAQDSRI
jgi:hypothetical protein